MKIRHWGRRVRYYPQGWFISTGVTPLGEPYAHAIHGSTIVRSFRWLFVRRRASLFVLNQLQWVPPP